MKASFFKRLAAYFIDIMIVTIIASIVSAGFSSTRYEKAYEEYEELMTKYTAQEITVEEYTDQIGQVIYEIQDSSVVVSIITVLSSIAYFIVFQYLNKGQTLGKKMLRLRVQENGKDPSIKAMIIRTLIVDSILSGILGIALLYILNKNNYYFGYSMVAMIEMMFVFVSVLFILYRKDKNGLHDIMAHTEVIDERGN